MLYIIECSSNYSNWSIMTEKKAGTVGERSSGYLKQQQENPIGLRRGSLCIWRAWHLLPRSTALASALLPPRSPPVSGPECCMPLSICQKLKLPWWSLAYMYSLDEKKGAGKERCMVCLGLWWIKGDMGWVLYLYVACRGGTGNNFRVSCNL